MGIVMTKAMTVVANTRLIPRALAELGGYAVETSMDCAVVELPLSESTQTMTGFVFGGVMMLLADAAAGLLTLCEDERAAKAEITTTMPQMNLNFVANTNDASWIRSEARYVRRGRRLSVIETRVVDDQGRLLVLATSHHVPLV
jgi:1,4-dihydroxy-2-naphthoyl-CoA hydrolase